NRPSPARFVELATQTQVQFWLTHVSRPRRQPPQDRGRLRFSGLARCEGNDGSRGPEGDGTDRLPPRHEEGKKSKRKAREDQGRRGSSNRIVIKSMTNGKIFRNRRF